MKQIVFKITSVCFALALTLLSAVTAFADDSTETLKINGEANVKAGDTVNYTLYLSDATEPIVGFELRLFYNSDLLEYQKGSLKFEKFDVVIYNEEIPGKIPMNCSSLTNLPSFEKKAAFLSADFKVLKGGATDITYFVTELYGENMTYLKNYKFTYNLSVNGETVISDGVPPVNKDDDTLNSNQGDFINYLDGMGENNTPNKDNHEAALSKNSPLSPYYQESVVEVTKVVPGESDGKKGGISGGLLFLIIAVPVVIAAVVAAVVIVNKKSKSADAPKDENVDSVADTSQADE